MSDKGQQLYEGKAKILYATDTPGVVLQYFKDDATAFNAEKKGTIVDKGVFNNRIATVLFELLEDQGIKTHFVESISEREMLCRQVEIVPLEVVVRNRIAGSFARRYAKDEGAFLPRPIVEFFYKDDDLGDPLMTLEHIDVLGVADTATVDHLRQQALLINDVLVRFFDGLGISLVDFKLEFGRAADGELILADEISPDTCRLWDKETGEKLDKDRFRRDLGEVEEAYARVMNLVTGAEA